MKITKRQLRRIIQEECGHTITLDEGWFSGALKGLARAIPGGSIAADAHTSSVIDDIDERLLGMEKRLAALERRSR